MKFNKTQKSEELPLEGLRFLVTRSDNKESSVTKMLELKGASVLAVPMIIIESPKSWELFDNALLKLDKIDWGIYK